MALATAGSSSTARIVGLVAIPLPTEGWLDRTCDVESPSTVFGSGNPRRLVGAVVGFDEDAGLVTRDRSQP